jgi:hypothetical protein
LINFSNATFQKFKEGFWRVSQIWKILAGNELGV